MSDDVKAKKIAAARKKLKAYQAKEKGTESAKPEAAEENTSDSLVAKPSSTVEASATAPDSPGDMKTSVPSSNISTTSFSKSTASSFDSETVSINGHHVQHSVPVDHFEHFLPSSNDVHSNTIELLINEKASLCAELAHYKTESKERSLAAEEANVRLQDALKRINKLETDLLQSQSHNAQLQNNIEQLNTTVVKVGSEVDKFVQENVELREHIEELKRALQKSTEQVKVLEDQVKEKECELELSRIRINQISDVASVENDSKVEALTQTKFMHEQQIRDLQAMVQQLETERNQSNQQYQSYVQHLNKEMTTINERVAVLTDENSRLATRERELVQHVGELEKQLQQIISQQSKQLANIEPQENDKKMYSEEEVDNSKRQLMGENNVLLERVRLQDVQLSDMQKIMDEKLEYIRRLEERTENLSSLQSDSSKLLAKVESNSVAASRAVAQNTELKQQLEEVEMKLIQVTNDKVELTNFLDSEKFANREMRMNYENLEKQVSTLSEKLHFKDEEMIRLTKENNELNDRIESMRNMSSSNFGASHEHIEKSTCQDDTHNGTHDHADSCNHGHDHEHHNDSVDHHHGRGHEKDDEHDCGHGHSHGHGADVPAEHGHNHEHYRPHDDQDHCEHNHSAAAIPQTEAMQKLETRFKSLMNDVANLTDEKQRLEHLVLQLQGETDTIGEYIALYQAQRRVLKQREIEKNTQMIRLKSEREELHNKIALLNQLVNNLSQQVNVGVIGNNNANISDQQHLQQQAHEHLLHPIGDSGNAGSKTPDPMLENQNTLSNPKQLNSNEIIHAIKNIVADIKNKESSDIDLDIVPVLDHCSCCSGKFETI